MAQKQRHPDNYEHEHELCECDADCCDFECCEPYTRECCGLHCVCCDEGAFFASIAWLVIGFVSYTVEAHAIPLFGPAWLLVHRVAYTLIICLIYCSHARAMWSDPGVVPLVSPRQPPEETMLSSESSLPHGAGRLELPEYCSKCYSYRPLGAHHCSTCKRCVARMDHHCGWVNNCVGERNLKHFLLFLLYVGLGSAYSLLLLGYGAWSFLSHEYKPGDFAEAAIGVGPSNMMKPIFSGALAFFLAICFLVFVIFMWQDQWENLINDTSTIDALQAKQHDVIGDRWHEQKDEGRRTLREAFTDVCGESASWRWLVPLAPPPRPPKQQQQQQSADESDDSDDSSSELVPAMAGWEKQKKKEE